MKKVYISPEVCITIAWGQRGQKITSLQGISGGATGQLSHAIFCPDSRGHQYEEN